jgi:hypothetical protein
MRKLASTGAVLTVLLAGIPAARADQVPSLDIEQVCRAIARHAGGFGERGGPDLTLRSCVASELRVRRKLARRWATYPAEARRRCTGNTTGAYPSYTDLLTCLEMARAARHLGTPKIEQ